VKYFVNTYNKLLKEGIKTYPDIIKWSHVLKRKFEKHEELKFDNQIITIAAYRPFSHQFYYYDIALSDLLTTLHFEMFGQNLSYKNFVINYTGPNSGKPFMTLLTQNVPDLHFVSAGAATQCLPLYHFDKQDKRIDNITEWGLQQFVNHYQDNSISKEEIFHYTYAVLHNPAYRKKYELNLKREFPRLPFYEDFRKWAAWGKTLMDLHINYETVNPWPLERQDFDLKAEDKRQKEMFNLAAEPEAMYGRQPKVKVKLKADKTGGIIEIDELTFLRAVPKEAWEYKLGNRTAIEWVLDQYKEKKPKDPTIAEKFNTYRFADYKEQVIDLLKRVCTVSVETVNIIKQMELEK
jgi:predicted helicase